MVKGAARAAGSSSTGVAQPLPTMQAGQNPSDPLTQLNGHQAFGAMAGFNPFADMGLNQNAPNMVRLHNLGRCMRLVSARSDRVATAPEHVGLARVSATDVVHDVEPADTRPDYSVEPPIRWYGPASS